MIHEVMDLDHKPLDEMMEILLMGMDEAPHEQLSLDGAVQVDLQHQAILAQSAAMVIK